MTPQTRMLPLDALVPHPANPRADIGDVTDLAASISSVGILQPIVVFEAPAKPGTYVILAGHRRHRAAKLLRLREVLCTIRTDSSGIDDQLVMMLVENVQRSDLGPVEKAEAFGLLRKRGLTLHQISVRVGLAESTISRSLALLELAPQTLEAVREQRVDVGVALEAVRETRRSDRRRVGGAVTGRPTVVEPHYFTARHPLAATARTACTHSTRPKVGGLACGECWETTIRADERCSAA